MDSTTATTARKCPSCTSPASELHPAVQFEGEAHVCRDAWHASTDQGRRALALSERAPSTRAATA